MFKPSAWLLTLALACTSLPVSAASQSKQPEENLLLNNIRQITLTGKRSGEGYFDNTGQKMIFQSERQADNPFYQMYVLDFMQGDIHRISTGLGKTTCGWIHPNGKQALFASTHHDPSSKTQQKTELDFRASGKERRYSWDFDPQYEIYQANLDGSGLKNLTQQKGYDAEGAYSPDGQKIVFASNRHAFQRKLSKREAKLFKVDPSSMMEIYIMDADGSNVQRLTDHTGYDGGPFFSADGKKITWRRFSEDGSKAEIYTMNTDGSDQKQLTRLGMMSWAPYFHPSGDYLIFATNKHGFGNFELYLVDAQGKADPIRVTYTPGFDGLPVFSPDGSQLSWTSNRSANKSSQIFLAQWNDTQARALLKQQGATFEDVGFAAENQNTETAIMAEDLKKHVTALSSAQMEGRLTGSPGEQKAAQYITSYFKKLGLEPAGTAGSYLQAFEFNAGADIGPKSALKSTKGNLELQKNWRPLPFSKSGAFNNEPIVFAGYGLIAPESGDEPEYDSYVHLDVKDKWVMVLRYSPENVSPERKKYLSRYSGLEYKAMLARNKGAKGLIVVSGPRSLVKNELVPFNSGAMSSKTSVFGVSIDNQTAQSWLGKKDLNQLQETLDEGKLVQGFDLQPKLSGSIEIFTRKKTGYNVLAKLNTGASLDTVIGAHYDHLGKGEGGHSLARSNEKGEIHYGADDNASGVAGVLELAEKLSNAQKSGQLKAQQNIVFALWSGEELGLIGSNYYVNQRDMTKVSAYINMDMIGRMQDSLVLQGLGSSSVWKASLESANLMLGLPLVLQSTSYLPTDATSFYLKKVPVLSAFTGAHSDYHTPRDTPEKLDYTKMQKIVSLLERVSQKVVRLSDKPDYIESEKPKNQGKRGLRVYLGTIPDYVGGDIKGLKISGATKGGPADKAGLKGGDIIVQLGGKNIENIYDYTYAIDNLKIGKATTVVIVRQGKRMSLTIVPGSRE